MSAQPLTILLIEDDAAAAERLLRTLDARFEVTRAARLDDGLERLAAGGFDAVLFGAAGFETVGRTLREREERRLHDALHDALTGLPNRTLFLDRLAVALKHRQREDGSEVAIIVLGLDRFRNVNDSLGHASGDRRRARPREPAPGAHRERRPRSRRDRPADAFAPARPRRAAPHRRLRHRLLVAELPAALPLRHGEDRPLVHQLAALARRREPDREHHHQPLRPPEDERHRRGRRDRRAGASAPRGPLSAGPGLLVRQAAGDPPTPRRCWRRSECRRRRDRMLPAARQGGADRG